MRKRMACALMTALAMLFSCAQAATYTYEQDGKVYLAVEDFEGTLPQAAQAVFASLLREGDEILCGTIFYEPQEVYENEALRGSAVLALRRNGKTVLMGAYREGAWRAAVETDSFFAGGESFSIRTQTSGNRYHDASAVLTCQDEAFTLRVQADGALSIDKYADAQRRIHCSEGTFSAYESDSAVAAQKITGILPVRLCAWRYDTFPRTPQQIEAFVSAHPLALADDEGYISGVNLRERATDQSPSWGKYTARVRILGSRPGRMASWVYVQIGGMTGWVSGMYLSAREDAQMQAVCTDASKVLHAGRAMRDTALYTLPGGAQEASLNAGTLMHVLGVQGGWVHVIVPRGEITWQTDWDGTYGFVREADMATGISLADAIY